MLAVIACHDKLTAGERRGEEREGEGEAETEPSDAHHQELRRIVSRHWWRI